MIEGPAIQPREDRDLCRGYHEPRHRSI